MSRGWPILGVTIVAALALSRGLWAQRMSNAEAGQSSSADALLCRAYGGIPSATDPHHGMVWIPSGAFTMGSNDAYPEEAEAVKVRVSGFWMDRHDVTNAQFAAFVKATGYVTVAERKPKIESRSNLPDPQRVPGSVVFVPPYGPGPGFWRFMPGADWHHPEGPGSDIAGRENHPVVHVAYEDALAYAKWIGRELPTEAQWEFAARGGLDEQRYVWGTVWKPHGKSMANTWQGEFPYHNTGEDGYLGTSPVGCFQANGYGLFDMAGEVWQWTSTWYKPGHEPASKADPRGPTETESFDPRQPGVATRVLKGGSHLCAPNYCMRYRPAARQAQDPGMGTSHIGFRTITHKAVI